MLIDRFLGWLPAQIATASAVARYAQPFRERGWVTPKALFSAAATEVLCRRTLLRHRQATETAASGQDIRDTKNFYGEPMGEEVLALATPVFETIVGTSLYPTYSYLRVYEQGEDLKRHTDRAACEYTVSVLLGSSEQKPWPIYIEAAGETLGVDLAPGDAVVFKGIELPHWRPPLQAAFSVHLFLHFVGRESSYAGEAYDRRPGLNTLPRAGVV